MSFSFFKSKPKPKSEPTGYSSRELNAFRRQRTNLGASMIESLIAILDRRLQDDNFQSKWDEYSVKRKQLVRVLNREL